MSKYTTGELAKLCGVTVRTVQYYDSRGILIPTELSEGGRRLYTDGDLRQLRVICFLRDMGLPIDAIAQLLAEEEPGRVVELLLEQQEQALRQELARSQSRLEKLEELRRQVKQPAFSVESIGDIAYLMERRTQLKRVHTTMLLAGVPMSLLEVTGIILWIVTGVWWPFVVYLLLSVPFGVLISRYYFRRVAYLCPQCHTVFRPALREAFFARHTPSARKLTCTCCGYHGFCVETTGGDGA